MLTFAAREKAYFANTFGRANQDPSDAEESSDDEPIPQPEPPPRRKKADTKVALCHGLACLTHTFLIHPDDLLGGQEASHGKDQAAQIIYTLIPSSEQDKEKDNDDEKAICEY